MRTVGGQPPAQQRAHPSQQLVKAERLDQVIVGAGIQPGHPVGHGVLGGQDQDGHIAGRAQAPADAEAVDARQHQIEQHEVGRPVTRRRQSRLAVGAHLDRVAFVDQPAAQQVGNLWLVLDHQDAFSHRTRSLGS